MSQIGGTIWISTFLPLLYSHMFFFSSISPEICKWVKRKKDSKICKPFLFSHLFLSNCRQRKKNPISNPYFFSFLLHPSLPETFAIRLHLWPTLLTNRRRFLRLSSPKHIHHQSSRTALPSPYRLNNRWPRLILENLHLQ